MTRTTALEYRNSIPLKGHRFFSIAQLSGRVWTLHRFLSDVYKWLSSWVKRQWSEIYHAFPFNVEAKIMWSCAFKPLSVIMIIFGMDKPRTQTNIIS
jgi:hypothetical protein